MFKKLFKSKLFWVVAIAGTIVVLYKKNANVKKMIDDLKAKVNEMLGKKS